MIFSDTDIDNMLQATGQTAVIDDGSQAGLTIYCKFLDPQRVVEEFGLGVEMTDPALKVRKSAVAAFIRRGKRVTIGGKAYTVKSYEPKTSGFMLLFLKDA